MGERETATDLKHRLDALQLAARTQLQSMTDDLVTVRSLLLNDSANAASSTAIRRMEHWVGMAEAFDELTAEAADLARELADDAEARHRG